jgi:hypothetical protein
VARDRLSANSRRTVFFIALTDPRTPCFIAYDYTRTVSSCPTQFNVTY